MFEPPEAWPLYGCSGASSFHLRDPFRGRQHIRRYEVGFYRSPGVAELPKRAFSQPGSHQDGPATGGSRKKDVPGVCIPDDPDQGRQRLSLRS